MLNVTIHTASDVVRSTLDVKASPETAARKIADLLGLGPVRLVKGKGFARVLTAAMLSQGGATIEVSR